MSLYWEKKKIVRKVVEGVMHFSVALQVASLITRLKRETTAIYPLYLTLSLSTYYIKLLWIKRGERKRNDTRRQYWLTIGKLFCQWKLIWSIENVIWSLALGVKFSFFWRYWRLLKISYHKLALYFAHLWRNRFLNSFSISIILVLQTLLSIQKHQV